MEKKPEVKGAVEHALEENKSKFAHLVDTEKTADAINDFFIKTVTSAMKPLQARRRPKDDEKWVIRSRAQVTKLLNQWRNEKERRLREEGV